MSRVTTIASFFLVHQQAEGEHGYGVGVGRAWADAAPGLKGRDDDQDVQESGHARAIPHVVSLRPRPHRGRS